MSFIVKYKLTLIGILTGSLAGYLYYYFVGCSGGTCTITSSPLNSTLYGGLMGATFLNMFKTNKPKPEKK